MTATMPASMTTGRRTAGVRSALAGHAAVRILACLAAGLTLGLLFPRNPVVLGIAQSGTWFPKTVVTFATAIIFVLMSAALAKTLLTHRRSGRFLLYVIGLYVLMGFVSLLYVSAWIPALTGLPMNRPGQDLAGTRRLAARHRDGVRDRVFGATPLAGAGGGVPRRRRDRRDPGAPPGRARTHSRAPTGC